MQVFGLLTNTILALVCDATFDTPQARSLVAYSQSVYSTVIEGRATCKIC